ncbi:MAG: cytochrome c biogenesis CcdA family protein [Calditrichaceae bacterium]
MIEMIFSYLTTALDGSFTLALFAAAGWGVLSIMLSPCHLSGIPLVIGYISSRGQIKVKHSFYLAFMFSIGILITIALIGLITVLMGRLMGDVGVWGNYFVAVIFILMGLYLMDIIHWDWNRGQAGRSQRGGLWGAFLLGLVFGIGLGPCTFAFLAPLLGVVFRAASNDWLKSVMLIGGFGFGHCAVIIAAGSLTNLVQRYLNWSDSSKTILYIKRAAGFLVTVGGLYFVYISFA